MKKLAAFPTATPATAKTPREPAPVAPRQPIGSPAGNPPAKAPITPPAKPGGVLAGRVVPPVKPVAKLTDEQLGVIALAPTLPILMLEAGAGCGKTHTLVALTKVLAGSGQYVAFNTALVAESKAKFRGTSCECNTIHSLAFRAEGKRFSHRLNIKQRTRSREVAQLLGLQDAKVPATDGSDGVKKIAAASLAVTVMGAVRNFCQSADRQVSAHHFPRMQGVDKPNERQQEDALRKSLLPVAERMWSDFSDPDGKLPYGSLGHATYLKVWQLNHPTISTDYLLLDEGQDVAPVMLDVMAKQIARGVKFIAVGDSCQQIYEFTGARNAMKAFPDATRRYLSQSFRFGEAVASVANAVLGHLSERTALVMKGLPTIPSEIGTTTTDTMLAFAAKRGTPLTEAVLTRTNTAAVAALLDGIAAGRKPFLVGGTKDLVSFVRAAIDLKRGLATDHPELACFSNWVEVELYAGSDEGEDLELWVKLIKEFTAEKILAALEQMGEEKDADLVISTAHKCVHPDTLVETPSGLVPIKDIADFGSIGTPSGPQKYSDKFTRELGSILTLTTERGYELRTSLEHGITIWRNGSHDRVEMHAVLPGDWVRVRLGSTIEHLTSPKLPKATSGDVREKPYIVPQEMTCDLAEFLGLMVADGVMIYGRTHGRSAGFRLGKRYTSVVSRFVDLVKSLFGYAASIKPMEGGTLAEVASSYIARWVNQFDGVQPHRKLIPTAVLRSSPAIQAAFLRGLFEDGHVSMKQGVVDHIQWNNMDYNTVGKVQIMLLRQGIVSSRRWAHDIGWLYIYSQHAKLFGAKIGFVAKEKNDAMREFGEDRHCLIPLTRAEMLPLEKGMTTFQKQNARAKGYISRNTAARVIEVLGPKQAALLVDRMQWSYERVASVDELDVGETICVTVPNGARFIQDGFDGWNSKGREWDLVKLAGDFPTLDKSDDSALRLLYVACTRAKLLLNVSRCPPFCGGKSRRKNACGEWTEQESPVVNIDAARRLHFGTPGQTPTAVQQPADLFGDPVPTPASEAPPTMPAKAPALVLLDGKAPTDNTFAKSDAGAWLIRGPRGQSGRVKVRLKSGKRVWKSINRVVWENDVAALYSVKGD